MVDVWLVFVLIWLIGYLMSYVVDGVITCVWVWFVGWGCWLFVLIVILLFVVSFCVCSGYLFGCLFVVCLFGFCFE